MRTSIGVLVPDGKWIRHHIPIDEVAEKLGLKRAGRYFWCWHLHPPHDRRPKVGIHVQSNTARCFRCDARSLPPLDLVMAVLDVGKGDAFRWFAREWPEIPKVRLKMSRDAQGNTARDYQEKPWPELTCDTLVLSPAWAKLSHAGRALAAAIIARIPREPDTHPLLTASYPEMMAWSGIGNRSTLSRTLRRLQTVGLIQIDSAPTGRETPSGWATRQTLIRLTPFSRRCLKWLAQPRDLKRSATHTPTATSYIVSQVRRQSGGRNGGSLDRWQPPGGARVQ